MKDGDHGTDEKTPTDDSAGRYSLAFFYDDFGDASAALGERAKAISREIKDSGLNATARSREEFHAICRIMSEWARHLLAP